MFGEYGDVDDLAEDARGARVLRVERLDHHLLAIVREEVVRSLVGVTLVQLHREWLDQGTHVRLAARNMSNGPLVGS